MRISDWSSDVCSSDLNTPFLVQIFIFYFGLSSVGVQIPAPISAVITMVINVGAYSSEIIRAGMDAIPAGQLEEAECLGLSKPPLYWLALMQRSSERRVGKQSVSTVSTRWSANH